MSFGSKPETTRPAAHNNIQSVDRALGLLEALAEAGAGVVVGAISAPMPAMRATDEHVALARSAIIAATSTLNAELGKPGSQTMPVSSLKSKALAYRTTNHESHKEDVGCMCCPE
jgi:hypothetical protein